MGIILLIIQKVFQPFTLKLTTSWIVREWYGRKVRLGYYNNILLLLLL